MRFQLLPWVHAQKISQVLRKADWWCRHLTIGRLVIMWDAPKHRKPPCEANIWGIEPTRLKVPNREAEVPKCVCCPAPGTGRPLFCEVHDQPMGTGE